MRVSINLLLTTVVVVMLGACHHSHGWVKYSSNADGFSIYMPAQPKQAVKQEQTAFGKQSVHYFSWKPETFDINKLKLLQVSYTDCPRHASADSSSLSGTLENAIGIVKRNYTELDIPSERIKLDGYTGRAFIFQDDKDGSITIVKTCVANNKIYTVTAVVKKDYPTNDELNTYFNSFQILR
jgi:hypothetical protein